MLASLLACAAIVHAGSLPACGSQFQYSCASPTLGGYTVITPLSGTGSTEITGFNSSNAVVFDQTIPAPPTGPPGVEVSDAVLQADARLAVQSGQASTLPACASTPTLCIAFNPGLNPTSVLVTASQTYSYIAQDTLVTQTVNQYSTTLIAKLNGGQILSETFGAQFSDPSVQAAILSADALLTGDGASFGAPSLISGATNATGSEVSYLQTGRQATGTLVPTVTEIFGPVAVVGCSGGCPFSFGVLAFPGLTLVLPGQLNINDNADIQFAIDRTVTTTNTFLTTQTYEIDGTTSISAAPEPATFALVGLALLAVACGITKGKK